MIELQPILEQFGLRAATLEPLGHSQNTNHVVTATTGERYLLRQHRTDSYSLSELESEMIWLNHLHSHKLEVQRPVPLKAGNYILNHSTGRYSLLTWLEGVVLDELSETQAENLGALTAQLHVIAKQFVPPDGFERLRYDAAYLEGNLNILRGVGRLHDDLPLLEQAMTRAQQAFDEDTERVLIHADLHSDNVIVQASKIAVIDFDRCGFGPIIFDVVTALGYLEQPSRTAFLRGYGAVLALPERFEERRGAFTVAEWLTNLAFLAPRPEEREYVDTIMLPGLREQLPKLLEKL
jgi:Ser/Thr protein kinase RdoA (MazF antagonist)